MPFIITNGIKIAYETMGSKNAPAILLIHGLGMPLTGWPESWRRTLSAEGFYVICIDNRDAGQSDILDYYGTPSPIKIAFSSITRHRMKAFYSLKDMAKDSVGILDHLGVEKANIIGASMGGMITQRLAIHYPERVKSLTAIMTMTGDRQTPQPSMKVQWTLMTQPPIGDRQTMQTYLERLWRTIGSPAYPSSDEYLKKYINGLLDRGLNAKGSMRQLAAILAEEDRSPMLSQLDMPSLVIHGEADPLVSVTCGKQVAEKIPRAKLHIEPGMGHDFPQPLEDKLLNIIITHIKNSEQ